MAHRDRSQGFGFVYVNIKKLLDERDALLAKDREGAIDPQVAIEPEAIANVVNLNRDPRPAAVAPAAPVAPQAAAQPTNPEMSIKQRTQAIAQLKENLDRLQSLHHRLHSMLEELNTGKKKNN